MLSIFCIVCILKWTLSLIIKVNDDDDDDVGCVRQYSQNVQGKIVNSM